MNLLVSFDLIFSNSAKPYFCLVRLEKARGKAVTRDWFGANLRGNAFCMQKLWYNLQGKAWMLARLLPFWT